MKKSLVVMIMAALVASAFVAPAADAKKKKKKKPAACAAYVPGEQGAASETFKITDAATAEAPVEIPVTLEMSTADIDQGLVSDPSTQYVNVQVDSAAKEAGLYLTFEFPTRRDYDLYVRYPDSSEAASSHGFNPAIEANVEDPVFGLNPSNTTTNHAGDSQAASENIIGLKTADCGGWTVETTNWLGEGGDMIVKAWLGEIANDPRPMGETP
jgi:hypothetical protein